MNTRKAAESYVGGDSDEAAGGPGGIRSSGDDDLLREEYYHKCTSSSSYCEIEEEEEEEEKWWAASDEMKSINQKAGAGAALALDTIREEVDELEEGLFSFDFHQNVVVNGSDEEEDAGRGGVYVTVAAAGSTGKKSWSMDALLWTLNHIALLDPSSSSSTVVYLVHVFPETKFIPMPLGMIPVSQVNPEQKEKYMVQERSKRRDFLQDFINVCSASKVKVDTILIESDTEAKAILDLISILNIRRLVVGTTKANLRRMRSSRRGNIAAGIADEIKKGAPEFCDVKIICEGKEISSDDQCFMIMSHTSPKFSPPRSTTQNQDQQQPNIFNDSFTCSCFVKRKVTS